MLGKWRINRLFDREATVDISEVDGVRYLHLGSSTVQSAMKLSDPSELVLSYTRAMMGFLLFAPVPTQAAMIGLGGGSLPRYMRHHMPGTRITVVECNPQVISAAHRYFEIPNDDQNLSIVLARGEQWIVDGPVNQDVLMVDGYDGRRQVSELSTDDFYAQARRMLALDGVLVVNLWSSDKQYDVYLQRIERNFDSVVTVPAERKGNIAVLAFNRRPKELRWVKLRQRARELRTRYALDFIAMLDGIREINPISDKELRI